METNELLAAAFFAAFTANAVLLRSAGLDSIGTRTRGLRGFGPVALTVAVASLIVDAVVWAILSLPFLTPSTLLDATLVVLVSMLLAYGSDIILKRYIGKKEWKWMIFNTAVCGIVLLARANSTELVGSLIYSALFSASVCGTYAIVAIIREDMCEHRVPHAFSGVPLLLLLLGLSAMALEGYAGVRLI